MEIPELSYPFVLTIVASICTIIWLGYIFYGPEKYLYGKEKQVSVQVLVLGDIGRSPRMTYHALSIAKHGGRVDLIGYLETDPFEEVVQHDNITIHALPPPPKRPASVPFVLFAPWKVLVQVYQLTWLLAYGIKPSRWLLVQNPPSIPTLVIATVICYMRNTALMIDWHNYGWTILAGTRGANHPLVTISKWYECFFGRFGSYNLTVTDAMGRQLRQEPYNITTPMQTVHDRPAAIFQPREEKHRKADLITVFPSQHPLLPGIINGTTRLVVSSTSWTPDEDFSLLLEALVQYANSETKQALPPLLVVITGKGPQQAMYLERIEALTKAGKLPNVTIETVFLPFGSYADLLSLADLGVCLHKSSSGVDLPMKVVDMFGAGLPVAAYSGYESFKELVREGDNGRGFETAEELADILRGVLSPGGKRELEVLRKGAIKEGSKRWDDEWDPTVGVVLGLTERPETKPQTK